MSMHIIIQASQSLNLFPLCVLVVYMCKSDKVNECMFTSYQKLT